MQKELLSDFYVRRYNEIIKSISEAESLKINIHQAILRLLMELGFDVNYLGTKYLATLIEMIYHERRIFDGDKKFFNFDAENNAHYCFVNELYNSSLADITNYINESVTRSYVGDKSLNSIIYSIVNDVIRQYDKGAKSLVITQESAYKRSKC